LTFPIEEHVPLAPLTTLGLGGPARYLVRARDRAQVAAAFRWAAQRDLPTFVLGEGSNLVVGDEGFSGVVVQPVARGQHWTETETGFTVEVAAGEPWDDVVAESMRRGVAGLECLSGIPGHTGAAPVQNIGAYGHEVAEVVGSVEVLDRSSLDVATLDAHSCGFAYRDSIFKREPNRFVILSVTLNLRRDAEPVIRYAELAAALASQPRPSPAQARQVVIALRRKKSMVFDPDDENRHSAGSFFTNPVVDAGIADDLVQRALADGSVTSAEQVPRFGQPDGRVKLAAGWLIERSGIQKGLRMGPVGISTRHALALVHHGGGTTADLLRLAMHVRQAVRERFGITLTPEPVFLGVDWPAC
jgi:UDP-N-acetylmuramate dehydrogenase